VTRSLRVATRNEHKLRELGRLLTGFQLVPPSENFRSPPEDGETYRENALIKARALYQATGNPGIADDSGIEAQALGGRPGVFSARYAGSGATDEANLKKFCDEVPADSDLRYVCVIAYVDGETTEFFTGVCNGKMAAEPRGNNGFGYDPIFTVIDDPQRRTMAQLSDREKDKFSHRGHAVAELRKWLDA
jgi:XTP/dITP diphosphohydrolase